MKLTVKPMHENAFRRIKGDRRRAKRVIGKMIGFARRCARTDRAEGNEIRKQLAIDTIKGLRRAATIRAIVKSSLQMHRSV